MASKKYQGIAYSIVARRIITLLSLIAVVVLLLMNRFKLSDGSKYSFKDFDSYRYVLVSAIIGAAYTIVQLPFSVYYASSGKHNAFLKIFAFLGDKVISLLLATGVGVGFGVSVEFKKTLNSLFEFVLEIVGLVNEVTENTIDVGLINEFKSKEKDFLNKAIIASVILLFGCLCMVLTSVLSSLNRNAK